MRISALIIMATVLTGCQLPNLKPETPEQSQTSDAQGCYIGEPRLSGLLLREKGFLEGNEKARKKMLKESLDAEDHAQSALLQSQPGATPKELKTALTFYRKQPVNPILACPGDRYVILRQQQAQHQIRHIEKYGKLLEENAALRTQIEALTQIERDLTRSREGIR